MATHKTITPGPTIKYLYGEAIVDTGASTNLLSPAFEEHLTNTRPSGARIQGFEGSTEIEGRMTGIGHLYILGSGPDDKGFQLSTNFDTVSHLNSNLFSISSLYGDHGFSLLLHNKDHESGRCELYRRGGNGKPQSIPIKYDPNRSAFMIRFVIGKDRKGVVQYGKAIERKRKLSLVEIMRCPTKLRACEVSHTRPRASITSAIARNLSLRPTIRDIDQPHSTHTSLEASTFIPKVFTQLRIAKAITFRDQIESPPEPESKEEWDKHVGTELESVLLGAKGGMKGREKRMSELELHTRHGHVGPSGGSCTICNLLKGSFIKLGEYTPRNLHTSSNVWVIHFAATSSRGVMSRDKETNIAWC